jgi:hypothetical protein
VQKINDNSFRNRNEFGKPIDRDMLCDIISLHSGSCNRICINFFTYKIAVSIKQLKNKQSKKAVILMTKSYWVRLILGSIVFGVLVFGGEVYSGGAWNRNGLWSVLYGIVAFGVLFHLLYSFVLRYTKKKNGKK